MKTSLIGWVVIGVVALVWELLGVAGWDGIWPLTWLIRDMMNSWWPSILFLIVFWVWLGYHFFVEDRTYH